MDSLGFFYQCGPQPIATAKVLENVRKYYPLSTICLVIDGGYSGYQAIAEQYKCSIKQCDINATWGRDPLTDDTRPLLFLNRILCAIRTMDETWVTRLEDDVIFKRRVKINHDHIISGHYPVPRMPINMQKYLEKMHQGKKFETWSMCGGFIADRITLENAIKNFLCNIDIDLVYALSYRKNKTNLMMHTDYLLTIVCNLFGIEYNKLDDFSLNAYDDCAIWHGCKAYYVNDYGPNEYKCKICGMWTLNDDKICHRCLKGEKK